MGRIKLSIFGSGMFGGAVVKAGAELGIPGAVMNASKDDIEALGLENYDNVSSFVVGDGKGTGKSRDIAKEFLLDHVTIFEDPKIDDLIQSSDLIIVAGSVGGGFGSGVVPTTVSILNEMYEGNKLFIPLTVLPDDGEAYTAQRHAENFLREILSQEVPYIMYDNNKFKELQPSVMFTSVIETIKKDLKVLRGDYITDEATGSNMDERDLLTTVSTPGRLIIGSIDPYDADTDVIKVVKESIDKSAHAELEDDKVIMASATMYNLSEDVLATYGSKIKPDVQTIFGDHITNYANEATYVGIGNQFVSVILAGCSAPNKRINQIVDLRKKKENIISSRKPSVNKLMTEADSGNGLKLGVKTFGGTPTATTTQRPSVSDIVKKMKENK